MKLYKVLNSNMMSPFQNFKFKIGEKYHCDDFDCDISRDCSSGFHAVDIEGLPFAFNTKRKIFEVQVSGKSVEFNQYKRRYENIKIIRECEFSEIKKKAIKLESDLGYKLSEVLFPINPLKKLIKINDSHIELLREWASVCASVRASVCASVGARVCASVGASVGAYISSLFPNIEKWERIEHEKGKNPFQSCVDLWNSGIVPSFDGKLWRLHSGKKAKIIWEGKI